MGSFLLKNGWMDKKTVVCKSSRKKFAYHHGEALVPKQTNRTDEEPTGEPARERSLPLFNSDSESEDEKVPNKALCCCRQSPPLLKMSAHWSGGPICRGPSTAHSQDSGWKVIHLALFFFCNFSWYEQFNVKCFVQLFFVCFQAEVIFFFWVKYCNSLLSIFSQASQQKSVLFTNVFSCSGMYGNVLDTVL